MANINKTELTRVNMNLPTKIVMQVKEYSEELGLPTTQGYIMLLNQALEQKDMLKNMPSMLELIKDMNKNIENIKKVD